MNEVVRALSQEISIQAEKEIIPLLSNQGYDPLIVESERFQPLTAQLVKKSKKTVFVDGGQAELFTSSHFCLSLVRVAYCIYEQRNCVKRETTEFYVFVTSKQKEDIYYSVKIFPIKGNYFPTSPKEDFHSFDKTLTTGSKRSSPTQVSSVIRRFAELEVSSHLASLLHEGDRIVLDGSLQSSYVGEEEYLVHLKKTADKNGIVVASLSKTSSLMTTKGKSYALQLRSRTEHDQWMFNGVHKSLQSDSSLPTIAFAQLHPKSKLPYCVESFSALNSEFYDMLGYYAADPVFLGYPYGLIEADRLARVSKQDANFVRTKLQALLGKSDELEAQLSTVNAHDVLDKISF